MNSTSLQSEQQVEQARVPWGAVLIVVIGAFMSILDTSIVNVALPRMMAVFGSTTDDIQWVLTGYLLASGVVIPMSGFLCDRWGHKRMYLIALISFTVGSAFCGLAWSTASIILARVIQALGGGLLIPISMSIVYHVVPQEKIGVGLGVWGLSAALGPATGPTLGGYLVDNLGWPWIFGINIPVGIVGSLLAFYYLRETPLKSGVKLDIGGAFFVAAGCFCLLLALSEGQNYGWTSQYIITLLIVAVFSLVLFVYWESNNPNPLIDITLLKNPILLSSIILTFLTTIGMMSLIFVIPIYAQNLLGYSPTDTVLMLIPMALATGVMMPIGGKLFDKFGAAAISTIGLTITVFLTYYLHTLSLETPYHHLQLILALRAVGFGLMMMPIANAGMNTVPQMLVGRASALINTVRQIAGSMGIALCTYIISQRQAYHWTILRDNVSVSSPVDLMAINQINYYLGSQGLSGDNSISGTIALISNMAIKNAAMYGIDDVTIIISFILAIGLPFMFLLRSHRVKKERAKQELLWSVHLDSQLK